MELVPNVDQWISQVTKANDGDNRDAANIAIAVEGLADRTFHLYTHTLLDTTAKPAGNLGTWDFGETSNVLFKGGVTFTPTSTVFFSNSGSTTFANTPSFVSGFSASTSGTVAISVAANLSGTTTLSGATDMSGVTTIVGSGNRLKLTTRTVERVHNFASASFGDQLRTIGASFILTPIHVESTNTIDFSVDSTGANNQVVTFPLDIPHGCTLQSIDVEFSGNANVMFLLKRNVTAIGAVVNPTPGSFSMTLNVPIDKSVNSYSLAVRASSPSGAKTLSLIEVKTRCLVSEYDEG